jgi:hypothetical protein
VALGQDRLILGVDEQELPFGEHVVQLAPVVVKLLAVDVVLRPHVVKQIADRVPELWLFAIADNLRIHAAKYPRLR